MAKFQNRRRTGKVCHRMELPRSSARTRLANALQAPQMLASSLPAAPDAAASGVGRVEPIWSVTKRPLPPAKIYAPPTAVPKEKVVERVIEKVREVTRVRQPSVEEAIETVRKAGAWPQGQASEQQQQEIALLHRRLAKVSGLLDTHAKELARLRTQKTVDTGVASKYREVQGIDENDEQAEAKKEMMSQLFAANLKLRQGMSSQKRSGD